MTGLNDKINDWIEILVIIAHVSLDIHQRGYEITP